MARLLPTPMFGPLDQPVKSAPAGGTCVTNPPCAVAVPTLNITLVIFDGDASERGPFTSSRPERMEFFAFVVYHLIGGVVSCPPGTPPL